MAPSARSHSARGGHYDTLEPKWLPQELKNAMTWGRCFNLRAILAFSNGSGALRRNKASHLLQAHPL
eukprot:4045687-Amphidinium_carterae.1